MKNSIHIIITLIAMNLCYIANSQTNLTLDVSDVRGTMDGRGVGFCNSFITDRPELTPNLKKTGTATLRYPMGGLAKNYLFHNFDNDYNDLESGLRPRVVTTGDYFLGNADINTTTYEFNPELMDFDEFMAMCNEVGAEPVIMLSAEGDLLNGSTISKEQLMRNHIEWVRYAKEKGYNIKYWEFGNEVHFGRPHSLITVGEYASRYLYLQDTLKKIDPNIKLGAVTVGYNNHTDIVQMLEIPELISNLDFFVTHQYNVSGILDYPTWRDATQDIVNPFWDNTKDDIRDIKRAIKYFDDSIPQYPNLANIEYLITEFSTHNAGSGARQWYDGGQHISQSISGFQQIANIFLYDQRIKYGHFWVTTSPFGNRNSFEGDAEAFDMNNGWKITPQGMPVLIYNNFVLDNLIQPVVNGTVGCYASSTSDSERLTLFIINKNDVATDVEISLSNMSPNLNAQLNTKWIYSGSGDPYDKNPILRRLGSATVNNTTLSTSLNPISLTIIELGVSPEVGSAPEATNSLKAINNNGPDDFIIVSFDAVATAEFYELERKTGNGAFEVLTLLDADDLSYKDVDVAIGQNYTYRLRAGNVHGYSDYSNVVGVVTAGSVFKLKNEQGTNLVLDGTDDEVKKTFLDSNKKEQEWLLLSNGQGFFQLLNNHSNKYLAVSSGNIFLTNDSEDGGSFWEFQLKESDTYFLQEKNSGLYLAGAGTSSGSSVGAESYLGWAKQQWTKLFIEKKSYINTILNGDFESGGTTAPPLLWSQKNGDVFAQTRLGTWASLVPNGEQAFGARILEPNTDPFSTMLFKPMNGDLFVENKAMYNLSFLVKSNISANISVKVEWVQENGNTVLEDTVVTTSGTTDWSVSDIPILIDQSLDYPIANVLLTFGFADNPPETFIMLDDIVFTKNSGTLSTIEQTENEALKNIRIYPNPWYYNKSLNIELGGTNMSKIAIYDLKGIEVFSENVNMNKLVIKGGVINPGLYILTVMQKGQKKHFKLIIK